MDVELRPEGVTEGPPVAVVSWNEGSVEIACDDDEIRGSIRRAFRPSPVLIVDDAAYRGAGTYGEVVVEPGDLAWFRAVAQVRVPSETGLRARLRPATLEGGFDPAAGYRTFEEQLERMAGRARPQA